MTSGATISMLEPRDHCAVDPTTARQLSELVRGLAAQAPAKTHSLLLAGESVTIPASVYEAVLDVLNRFGRGDGVVIGTTDALLTTSQAAKLIGISATYLLRLLDNGTIPVHYRGTHRRIRLADASTYLASRSAPQSAPNALGTSRSRHLTL